MLFDGAYLGCNGEPISIIHTISKVNGVTEIDAHSKHPSPGKIIAYNPGAERISRYINLYPEGRSLALARGKGYEKIGHVEAENAKLIREATYAEIFRYLGRHEVAQMLHIIGMAAAFIQGTHEEQSAYQVTKEGAESGLFLVDEDYQPGSRPPPPGGSGRLRHRDPLAAGT